MSSFCSHPDPARWMSPLPPFKVMGTEAQRGTELCRPQDAYCRGRAELRAWVMASRANGRLMEPKEPEEVGMEVRDASEEVKTTVYDLERRLSHSQAGSPVPLPPSQPMGAHPRLSLDPRGNHSRCLQTCTAEGSLPPRQLQRNQMPAGALPVCGRGAGAGPGQGATGSSSP